MNEYFKQTVLKATGATGLYEMNKIQDLWSGYGVIKRYGLKGGPLKTVVVKHIQLPQGQQHPLGWNSSLSHDRKLKSYQVEVAWYHHWSSRCSQACHVPNCLASETHDNEIIIVLEDLNATGFGARRHSVSRDEIKVCLNWLAHFHATFLGQTPKGLWPIGTYWHLDTRPEELDVLDDMDLKQAAPVLDHKLNSSPFLTFVHGDAKLANFCFSPDGTKVAAVDFQYIGGGCGMKDVAYFLGSCLYENECEKHEKVLLEQYFSCLKNALNEQQKTVDFEALKSDWTDLYPVAWTDFHRFIKGWSPGYVTPNSYSERLARKVIDCL